MYQQYHSIPYLSIYSPLPESFIFSYGPMLLSGILSFQVKALPLAFLTKVQWWGNPSAFVYLGKLCFLLPIWTTALQYDIIFLVFFHSVLWKSHCTPFWPLRFLLRNLLIDLYFIITSVFFTSFLLLHT